MSCRTLFLAMSLLVSGWSAAAAADDLDPFGIREDQDTEEVTDGRSNIQDEAQTFSGPMEKLLNMAGESEVVQAPRWSNFEKPQPVPEEKYDIFFEYKMKEEAGRPVPQRPAYKGDLDSLRRDLEIIKPANRREEESYFKHLYRGDPVK